MKYFLCTAKDNFSVKLSVSTFTFLAPQEHSNPRPTFIYIYNSNTLLAVTWLHTLDAGGCIEAGVILLAISCINKL